MTYLSLAGSFIDAARASRTEADLIGLMEAVAAELSFRFYALIDHVNLAGAPVGQVNFKAYPAAVTDRLIAQQRYRRDPIIRGCVFADSAFVWSEVDQIIPLDRKDRDSFDFGARAGLNEGITIPYNRLGTCMGSCTFAGTAQPDRVPQLLGVAQMIGIFAFQAARRIVGPPVTTVEMPRLHPRPRDCIILAGRGMSNKEIARALSLTPRTVDGYLTEARRLFDAHDRTELVISAVLAGEVGLHELRRQPE